jgi:hypothetical protein
MTKPSKATSLSESWRTVQANSDQPEIPFRVVAEKQKQKAYRVRPLQRQQGRQLACLRIQVAPRASSSWKGEEAFCFFKTNDENDLQL